MARALILLAGTSESGKSSAGVHLARDHRARRVKIRSILTELTSGRPVTHEGVTMREGFDRQEFLTLVRQLPEPGDPPVLVIESFIDADLADATKQAWSGPARIVFITATRANRITRLSTAADLGRAESAAVIDGKDARKRVMQQWHQWRSITDDWIDNDGDYPTFLTRLDAVLIRLTTDTMHEGMM